MCFLVGLTGSLSPCRPKGRTTASHQNHGLHCRICPKDLCDDLTATMCGHLFCNRCVELMDAWPFLMLIHCSPTAAASRKQLWTLLGVLSVWHLPCCIVCFVWTFRLEWCLSTSRNNVAKPVIYSYVSRGGAVIDINFDYRWDNSYDLRVYATWSRIHKFPLVEVCSRYYRTFQLYRYLDQHMVKIEYWVRTWRHIDLPFHEVQQRRSQFLHYHGCSCCNNKLLSMQGIDHFKWLPLKRPHPAVKYKCGRH